MPTSMEVLANKKNIFIQKPSKFVIDDNNYQNEESDKVASLKSYDHKH